MTDLLHDLILQAADQSPERECLVARRDRLDLATLAGLTRDFAAGLLADGFEQRSRVGVYLPKSIEAVSTVFGTCAARGIAVPINPVLKGAQAAHILRDSGATVLVTSPERLPALAEHLDALPALRQVVVVGAAPETPPASLVVTPIDAFSGLGTNPLPKAIDSDVALLMYTSGSTGRPKGVVLTHRNVVAGAKSVASYLGNSPDDRILAVLPLSFDAGFSQLTTGFLSGATVVLHDYLLPKDTLAVALREKITGITAVPPLWMQLAGLEWPDEARASMRYFANTGGKMPRTLLERLRSLFPDASPFLMYGLTEAFRSTYLPPSEVDNRPDSIGKAIPNAEVLVVNDAGDICGPDEPGELVHRGALVAQGYWNDPEKTAQRFKPAPGDDGTVPITEVAVWSGDIVRRDADGYLYFVGRNDEMIKSSGYRISPTELEEALYASGLLAETAAFGVDAGAIGHEIVVYATPRAGEAADTKALLKYCRQQMPTYMIPSEIIWRDALPRSPNGKIDRSGLRGELASRTEDTNA